MKKLFEKFLDLIYKKRCYFCKSSAFSLKMCPKCYEKLEFNDIGANRIIEGTDVYSAGYYTKELQKLIRGVKYHKQKELAYYQAKFMYDYFLKIPQLQNKNFLLIPVPLHTKRLKKRGYNHMELVCEEFSKLTGFQYDFNLITRCKNTKPQYNLSRAERLKNLQNAFIINKSDYNKTPILLLDDICTTGSTFEEIIKTLKNSGINEITCFATATPS